MANEHYNVDIRDRVAATVVRILIPVVLVVALTTGFSTLVLEKGLWARAIPPIFLVFAMGIIYYLERRGRVRASATTLIGVMCVAVIGGMITSGGVYAPVYSASLAILAVVAWLYGHWAAILYTLVSTVIGGVFVLLTKQGVIATEVLPPPLLHWILLSAFHFGLLIVTAVPYHMLREALLKSEERRLEAEASRAREQDALRELEQREAALRESEARYRDIFEKNSAVKLIIEPASGRIVEANSAAGRFYGYPREELTRKYIWEINTLGRDETRERMQRALSDMQGRFEFVHRLASGETRDVTVYTGVVDVAGQRLLHSIIIDVTEQARAQRELHLERQRLAGALEGTRAATWEYDLQTDTLVVDARWAEIAGYTLEELAPVTMTTWFELAHPDDIPGQMERLQRHAMGESPFYDYECRMRHKNGKWIWVHDRGRVLEWTEDGLPLRMYGTHADITERKHLEEILRASEQKSRSLLNAMTEGVCLHKLEYDEAGQPVDYTILDVNPAYTRILGYSREQAVGARGSALYGVGGAPFLDLYARVALTGEPAQFGTYFAPLDRHFAISVVSPQPGQFATVFSDFTERKRAEAERDRLVRAIEQSGESIYITDSEGKIQFINSAFEHTTGFSRDEALGQNPRIMKSGVHGPAFFAELWATLKAGRTWNGDFINRRKDGTRYTAQTTIAPVTDENGHIVNFVAAMRDITEKLELEHQYRQAQKMEAIGQLTGGVAHDFNNLLQVINGYTEIAQMRLEAGHPVHDVLDEVSKAGTRASELVGQLLAFSRRQIMQPIPLHLNDVVAGLLKMLGRLIGEHIRLHFEPRPNIGYILADRGMLEQIVMNLCVNARDAMPTGGHLLLETDEVVLDRDFCTTHTWAAPGQFAHLRVADNGSGIAPDVLERIFEPFFTTKGVGKGTGLGLATVYGIVKQHDGLLHVESTLGQGSVFHVYLPISQEAAQQVYKKQDEHAAGGQETLLLAEDDAAVCQLAREILEDAGYRVCVAANGVEACALFDAQHEVIAMAILDVVMPEMGGRDAYEYMRKQRPDFPALFTTGYTEHELHTNFVLDAGITLLQKPYNHVALLRAVREALEDKPPSIE